MKKILFVAIALLISSCYSDDSQDSIEYNYTITISGNCEFITINDIIYHGLFFATPYVESGVIEKNPTSTHTIKYKIEKHTNDTSSVNSTLEINNIIVNSQTTSDPYGYILVDYSI